MMTRTISAAILAGAMFLSPTEAKAQAFTLIDQPPSHLYIFAPVDAFRQGVRLNAVSVFCTAVERLLFKFFDADGNTLMEETKSVACGRVASSELPFIERTDGAGPRVYALIAVLGPVRTPGNGQVGLCPGGPGPAIGPLATSLELIAHGTGGGAGMPDGSVRQTLAPSVQLSCASAVTTGRFSGAWGKTGREENR